jgi:hypothetical protein
MSAKIIDAPARQAITTKYLGPTNARGSRIQVSAAAGRMYVGYDHSLNSDENHRAAALAYCARHNLSGALVHGVQRDGSHVFVFVE